MSTTTLFQSACSRTFDGTNWSTRLFDASNLDGVPVLSTPDTLKTLYRSRYGTRLPGDTTSEGWALEVRSARFSFATATGLHASIGTGDNLPASWEAEFSVNLQRLPVDPTANGNQPLYIFSALSVNGQDVCQLTVKPVAVGTGLPAGGFDLYFKQNDMGSSTKIGTTFPLCQEHRFRVKIDGNRYQANYTATVAACAYGASSFTQLTTRSLQTNNSLNQIQMGLFGNNGGVATKARWGAFRLRQEDTGINAFDITRTPDLTVGYDPDAVAVYVSPAGKDINIGSAAYPYGGTTTKELSDGLIAGTLCPGHGDPLVYAGTTTTYPRTSTASEASFDYLRLATTWRGPRLILVNDAAPTVFDYAGVTNVWGMRVIQNDPTKEGWNHFATLPAGWLPLNAGQPALVLNAIEPVAVALHTQLLENGVLMDHPGIPVAATSDVTGVTYNASTKKLTAASGTFWAESATSAVFRNCWVYLTGGGFNGMYAVGAIGDGADAAAKSTNLYLKVDARNSTALPSTNQTGITVKDRDSAGVFYVNATVASGWGTSDGTYIMRPSGDADPGTSGRVYQTTRNLNSRNGDQASNCSIGSGSDQRDFMREGLKSTGGVMLAHLNSNDPIGSYMGIGKGSGWQFLVSSDISGGPKHGAAGHVGNTSNTKNVVVFFKGGKLSPYGGSTEIVFFNNAAGLSGNAAFVWNVTNSPNTAGTTRTAAYDAPDQQFIYGHGSDSNAVNTYDVIEVGNVVTGGTIDITDITKIGTVYDCTAVTINNSGTATGGRNTITRCVCTGGFPSGSNVDISFTLGYGAVNRFSGYSYPTLAGTSVNITNCGFDASAVTDANNGPLYTVTATTLNQSGTWFRKGAGTPCMYLLTGTGQLGTFADNSWEGAAAGTTYVYKISSTLYSVTDLRALSKDTARVNGLAKGSQVVADLGVAGPAYKPGSGSPLRYSVTPVQAQDLTRTVYARLNTGGPNQYAADGYALGAGNSSGFTPFLGLGLG